jgi:glycosyltransferase involved in cell wall biosynthesis
MLKAYNHERYIAQAIDSALAQRTSFDVEILIGEDCSSDGTRAIVMSYASRYPDRIRVLAHERNLGMARNTLALYGAARGEYVAWLDGDDYWIAPDKLQRQVEFLDSHPGYALCCHDSLVVGPDGSAQPAHRAPRAAKTFSLDDMLLGRPPYASAYVFRKLIDVFPPWFETLPYADFPLQVLHAERGLAMYFPDRLGAYRIGGARVRPRGYEGASGESFGEFCNRQQAVTHAAVNRHLDFRYDAALAKALLLTGSAAQRIYRLTPHGSRLRSRVWHAVKRYPALASGAIELAGALAAAISWMGAVRRRASRRRADSTQQR